MSIDHRTMTEHGLEKSRRILERQRKLIAARRAAWQPTAQSEKVLATFERSHAALAAPQRPSYGLLRRDRASDKIGPKQCDGVLHRRCFGHERRHGCIHGYAVRQLSEARDIARPSQQVTLGLVAKLAFEKFELGGRLYTLR
jgi:hypothetical protein